MVISRNLTPEEITEMVTSPVGKIYKFSSDLQFEDAYYVVQMYGSAANRNIECVYIQPGHPLFTNNKFNHLLISKNTVLS